MIPDFPHSMKIRLTQINYKVSALLAVAAAKFRQPTGHRLCKVRTQWNIFLMGSFFYIMRKVWYHQIWIQNYFGFIVWDLMYMLLWNYLQYFSYFTITVITTFHTNVLYFWCIWFRYSFIHKWWMEEYWNHMHQK